MRHVAFCSFREIGNEVVPPLQLEIDLCELSDHSVLERNEGVTVRDEPNDNPDEEDAEYDEGSDEGIRLD